MKDEQPTPPLQKRSSRKRKVKEEEEEEKDDKSKIVLVHTNVVRYTERKAPEGPVSKEPINLRLTDQFENEMSLTVQRSTPMKMILDKYYEEHNIERGSSKLVYDGRYCRGYNTPDEMGMEDDDEISIMTHSHGG